MCTFWWGEQKNQFASTILRLLNINVMRNILSNALSYERHTTLRLGGLHLMLILLKVNEDCHQGSNITIMIMKNTH